MLRAAFAAELSRLFSERAVRGNGRRPIVLLHGFAGWSRGLLPLEDFLARELSREVVRLRLGTGLESLESAAGRAAGFLARVAAAHPGQRIDVVAHSMGGLVASYLLKTIDRGAHLGAVITLGTPHRGTPFALAGARLLGRLGPSLAQMAPGSRFLEALEREPVPEGSALYSLAGLADLLVPAPCARLPKRPRHHNRLLSAADHWDLVYGAAAQRGVAQLLRRRREAPLRRRTRDAGARLRAVQ